MTAASIDPRVSEFSTEAEAASYDHWFRAKVQAALNDSRPGIPHDEVMAEMEAIIVQAEAQRATKTL